MIKNSIFVLILGFTLSFGGFPSKAWAQAPGQNAVKAGPRKQLATIIFSGLGGAILGLSTLSFYGRPQDKLSNIAVGFALGIIGGTVYSTYKTATQPYDNYQGEYLFFPERQKEIESSVAQMNSAQFTPRFSYNWTF